RRKSRRRPASRPAASAAPYNSSGPPFCLPAVPGDAILPAEPLLQPPGFMDELHHECGLAALAFLSEGDKSPVWGGGPDELSRLMPRMLMDLQNRGHVAGGMPTYRPDRPRILDTYKRIGTVTEAFKMSRPGKYASIMEDL